jgi:hypothetical protein
MGEVNAEAIRTERFALRPDGRRSAWLRSEVKVPADCATVTNRSRLVVTKHPYGNEWTSCIPFRSPYKKGISERPVVPVEHAGHPLDHASWIDSLPFDYWEGGAYLTAGLLRVPEPALPRHDSLRNTVREGLTVFGFFDESEAGPFNAVIETIRERLTILQMLADTAANRIIFWPPTAHWKTRPPSLYEEVIEDREVLMMVSIQQALAGPHKDPEAWLDRPIEEKVSEIYKEHLNRRNRRVASRRRRESEAGLLPPRDFTHWEQEYLDSGAGDHD